ncbi:MAG: transposase [Phycisphaerae bacterium]
MPARCRQPLLFDFLPSRELIVERSAGQITSDAGLLPIRQFDQRWGYTERMAACLLDPKPRRQQSLVSMLRQRMFGILAG